MTTEKVKPTALDEIRKSAKDWKLPSAMFALKDKDENEAFQAIAEVIILHVETSAWDQLINTKEASRCSGRPGGFSGTLFNLWMNMNNSCFKDSATDTPFDRACELLNRFLNTPVYSGRTAMYTDVCIEFMFYCFELLKSDKEKSTKQWGHLLNICQRNAEEFGKCIERETRFMHADIAHWYMVATESYGINSAIAEQVMSHFFRAFIYRNTVGRDTPLIASIMQWVNILSGPALYYPKTFHWDTAKMLSLSEEHVAQSCAKATNRIVTFCKQTEEFIKACEGFNWKYFKIVAIDRDIDLCVINSVTLKVFTGHIHICDMEIKTRLGVIKIATQEVILHIRATLKQYDLTDENVKVVFDVKHQEVRPPLLEHKGDIDSSFTLQVKSID